MCTCIDNRHLTLEDLGGARAFDMNERKGHLSSTEKGSGGVGVKGKRKEGRGCGVKSPSLSLSSVLTVKLMATDHSADPTSALLRLFSFTDLPPFTGPRKLLFRSLVQQIHTDARGRRTQRDKGFLSTCFPH